MKTLSLIIAFVIGILTINAQTEKAQDITVSINNFANNNGKALVALHTKNDFMKGKGIQSTESVIENGKVTVTFKDVQPGEYAIVVLHDENENYRMDFEDTGMPKENYAMSNNPISYGPPKFEDAKFEAEKDFRFDFTFTLNSNNEIVVLNVDSSRKDIKDYIRKKVNNRKIKTPDIKNDIYKMPITVKIRS